MPRKVQSRRFSIDIPYTNSPRLVIHDGNKLNLFGFSLQCSFYLWSVIGIEFHCLRQLSSHISLHFESFFRSRTFISYLPSHPNNSTTIRPTWPFFPLSEGPQVIRITSSQFSYGVGPFRSYHHAFNQLSEVELDSITYISGECKEMSLHGVGKAFKVKTYM